MQSFLKTSAIGLSLVLSACTALPNPVPISANTALPALAKADPQRLAAVKAKPNDPEAWYQLGNDYAQKDQLIEAELAYREVLQRGPHTRAQHNLGLVYIRLGIEALKKASTELPEDHPARQETRRFLRVLAEAGY